MRFQRSEEMKAAEFDLTPMIDVVLLLIIFFMLSSQFARVNAKAVNLPAESGETIEEGSSSHEVVVDIDAAGAISVLNRTIADAELEGAIRSAAANASDFVIRADRACMTERLNLVATTLMKQQVRSWKLAVAGEGGGGGGAGGSTRARTGGEP
jgi:biopolymer transport protein ExbD